MAKILVNPIVITTDVIIATCFFKLFQTQALSEKKQLPADCRELAFASLDN